MAHCVASAVERYIATFNEADGERRRAKLMALYMPDGTYTDPHVELHGPEQIDAFIASTQERFPGYEFRLGGPVDAHHNQARFQWHAGPAGDSEPTFVGFDVIVTDDARGSGRVRLQRRDRGLLTECAQAAAGAPNRAAAAARSMSAAPAGAGAPRSGRRAHGKRTVTMAGCAAWDSRSRPWPFLLS